ncbi:MAG: hypothetical protein AB7G15_00670 [Alphaproteobacteria bacterium]
MTPDSRENESLSEADRKNVLSIFFTLVDEKFFSSIEKLMCSVSAEQANIAKTFISNLNSAITLASIPFLMASNAIKAGRYDRVYIAEALGTMKLESGDTRPKNPDEKRARLEADRKFEALLKTAEFRQSVTEATLKYLVVMLGNADLHRSANELLRQVAVMTWGAIEVAVTDAVTCVVNETPELASKLQASEVTKKYLPMKIVSIDTLAEYEFNLSRQMGSFLFSERRMDSVPIIRDVLSTIFPQAKELHRKLRDDMLWLLCQRRHLIVHHRGVVDKAYLSKTPDKLAIGSQIQINSDDIAAYLTLARDIFENLLIALAKKR